jgi:hypothetical protein
VSWRGVRPCPGCGRPVRSGVPCAHIYDPSLPSLLVAVPEDSPASGTATAFLAEITELNDLVEETVERSREVRAAGAA